ncbi:YajG family lipoprotein [Pontibacter sp. JAM-7]|uniref:YajG family lipoprotein n=1 Tax=Pontibacter sp. JAM-7 TaxID=3366581 RepID=UPI003AF7DF32
MRSYFILSLTFLAMLSGCSAFVAQTVQPEPQVSFNRALPPGVRIQLETADLRRSQKLGNRLNSRNQQVPVSAIDLAATLNKSLQDAVIAAGINLAPSAMKFRLELTQLSYKANPEGPGQTVTVTAAMRIRLDNSAEHYMGQYSTSQEQRFVTTPNEGDNAHLINRALEATLQRGLNDPQLLDFMQSHQ